MLENIARLHGHAAVPGVYGLDAAAAGPMGELYNYFDWSKLDVDFHRDVRDYMAKSLQWLGSYVVFDVLDVDAFQYATWRRAHPGAVHRMDDPRGSQDGVPTCTCGEEAKSGIVKRVAKNKPKSDLGRRYYCCGKRDEDDGCDYWQWQDEPRDLGPLALNLTDLVASGYERKTQISPTSVARAGITYVESMYYMQAIGNEIVACNKASKSAPGGRDERHAQGPWGEDTARTDGQPMTELERKLCQILTNSGCQQDLALIDVRAIGFGTKKMKFPEWGVLVELAEEKGWATSVKTRNGRPVEAGAPSPGGEAEDDTQAFICVSNVKITPPGFTLLSPRLICAQISLLAALHSWTRRWCEHVPRTRAAGFYITLRYSSCNCRPHRAHCFPGSRCWPASQIYGRARRWQRRVAERGFTLTSSSSQFVGAVLLMELFVCHPLCVASPRCRIDAAKVARRRS